MKGRIVELDSGLFSVSGTPVSKPKHVFKTPSTFPLILNFFYK
jgi:hypothetical protein